MFLIGSFKFSNNFSPKYKIPTSARMIRILKTTTAPKILLLAKSAAIKKHNWFKGG